MIQINLLIINLLILFKRIVARVPTLAVIIRSSDRRQSHNRYPSNFPIAVVRLASLVNRGSASPGAGVAVTSSRN